ncbi:MAG: hypothetical protein OXD34_16390, partial [bacterium]|nr:hypothetical protein [bacterium]
MQLFAVGGGGQLIVGCAGHYPAGKAGNGVAVDHATKGARGEDVAVHVVDLVRGHHLDTHAPGLPQGAVVKGGCHHPGAFGQQVGGELGGHLSETMHGHPPALEAVAPPDRPGAGLH